MKDSGTWLVGGREDFAGNLVGFLPNRVDSLSAAVVHSRLAVRPLFVFLVPRRAYDVPTVAT